MSERRILAIWFPRLGVERVLRHRRDALPGPFAVVGDRNGAQVLVSVSPEAEALGLLAGQSLRDARAICPALDTVAEDARAEATFLTVLRRWLGKYSPWIAEDAPDGLVLDLTGCAHLFGGEAALLAQVSDECEALGLTLRAGLADTPGAAWALARFAGREGGGGRSGGQSGGRSGGRSGDDIAQEAHATRSKAVRRRVVLRQDTGPQGVIAPKGRMRQVLGPLPVAALRLEAGVVEGLARLGVRRIEDLAVLPRATLPKRFGPMVLRRLDQAFGLEIEPVTPAKAPLHFAARLSFPDPIGLLGDVEAGVDRLLTVLCAKLASRSRGARRVRLQAFRADGDVQAVEVGLARASDRVDSIRPLLALKLGDIDAGFGIDMLRVEAVLTEPLMATQFRAKMGEDAGPVPQDTSLDEIIGKLGTRLGAEAVTRFHPAESHAPERAFQVLAAAWSQPYGTPWQGCGRPRPLVMLRPEPVAGPDGPVLPQGFRWRRRDWVTRVAVGPERIAPEWWLDRPEWRSGPRDYWRVETEDGTRLWLFYAHGGEASGGWFCQGVFA